MVTPKQMHGKVPGSLSARLDTLGAYVESETQGARRWDFVLLVSVDEAGGGARSPHPRSVAGQIVPRNQGQGGVGPVRRPGRSMIAIF